MSINPIREQLIRRTRFLTQALIMSGALNIGLVSTFIYFVLKDKQQSLVYELKPTAKENLSPSLSNEQTLRAYSALSFKELLLRLENKEHNEAGLTKRDLALACLVAFHHFNLEKALGGLYLPERHFLFKSLDGQEAIDLKIFPGLNDDEYGAMMQYAKTEKWPLTSQGLFFEIQRSSIETCDPSLLEAFYLTPQFHIISTLFSKSGAPLEKKELVSLLTAGDWATLQTFFEEQRLVQDLSQERRRVFLLRYLPFHSTFAIHLLLKEGLEFLLTKLEDAQILAILDAANEKSPSIETFAKALLASPRSDSIWKRSATLLYQLHGEPLPQPYDHKLAMNRFFPRETVSSLPPILQETKPALKQVAPGLSLTPKKVQKAQGRFHTIQEGDTLWKIARKYRVSVDAIKKLNHLESERLRTGRQLQIPESKT